MNNTLLGGQVDLPRPCAAPIPAANASDKPVAEALSRRQLAYFVYATLC